MSQPKFTVYKHVKIDGKWRYCRAAAHSNRKLKQDKVIVRGGEEMHPEGAYCIRAKGAWIDAGKDALEAQRMRSRMLDQHDYKTPSPAVAAGRTPLAEAQDRYFAHGSLALRTALPGKRGNWLLQLPTLPGPS
jgi:hypothetical protein